MIFGPRTFGSQVSRPPLSSESKWKPTSRYERGPQPEKNGLTTSCAAIAVLPQRDQDKATAEPSCGKNICCSSNSPSARRNRETGHEMAPKRPSPQHDPKSVIGSSEE